MTYVAILRSAGASDREVVRLERALLERIGAECPGAKRIASGASSRGSECMDVFEAADDVTAAAIVKIARAPGMTEPVLCSAVPWELFAKDGE